STIASKRDEAERYNECKAVKPGKPRDFDSRARQPTYPHGGRRKDCTPHVLRHQSARRTAASSKAPSKQRRQNRSANGDAKKEVHRREHIGKMTAPARHFE